MKCFVPLENPEEVVSILSRISIFGGVSDVQQNEIFSRLQAGRFKQGEFIFQKGDEPSHIYIVRSGCIELFIPGKEATIRKKRLDVGDCFGQVAVMSIHQHTVSAVAVEDTEFIVLSKHALHQLHQEDVELFAMLMMNIARELARRVQFMDSLLLESIHAHDPSVTTVEMNGP